ncbi:MAG: Uma2 family endonuclease [Stenomitos rutilans HA7619-LM2]|jgi:Uma2 family endonuclease|nr:Uma2 family endonuclease [Stenomitos rutilans HA7619-LM2]
MVISTVALNQPPVVLIEDYLLNPPDHMEWVDGQLVEKNDMTLKTSRVQLTLGRLWSDYKNTHNLGGECYTETPCRTNQQIRRPDLAYLTPELLAQFGEPNVFPQVFPLLAEIVSPTDCAEDVFNKASEYLEAGCQEVWLVFPDSGWIVVLTPQSRSLVTRGENVSTQTILTGFSVPIDDLLGR